MVIVENEVQRDGPASNDADSGNTWSIQQGRRERDRKGRLLGAGRVEIDGTGYAWMKGRGESQCDIVQGQSFTTLVRYMLAL